MNGAARKGEKCSGIRFISQVQGVAGIHARRGSRAFVILGAQTGGMAGDAAAAAAGARTLGPSAEAEQHATAVAR